MLGRVPGEAVGRTMGLTERDFETVRTLVKEHAAIVLEAGKAYLVESRIVSVARREGFESIDALVSELRDTPFGALHTRVVDAMTTNETSFFRDLHPFEALRKAILPELVRRREGVGKLNLWCGASSSGQEAYTIAMVLREHFPQLRQWTVGLVATDISDEMLARARTGRFNQLEVNRGLPASMLVKYFTQHGADWEVKDEIRRMIEFRPMNLVKDWPPMPPLDVVFLRNVMIYFDAATKRQILGRIRGLLQPDGFLFLGTAETTLNADDAFERVPVDQSWAYRLRAS